MPKNNSVARFQSLMALIPKAIVEPIRDATLDEASRLARAMSFHAPLGPTRHLKDSVRVEQGKFPTRILVRAGGPLTTVHGYDYAKATEFGTSKEPAQPFFYSTYRAEKRAIRMRLKKAAKAAIAEHVKLT